MSMDQKSGCMANYVKPELHMQLRYELELRDEKIQRINRWKTVVIKVFAFPTPFFATTSLRQFR